jgi:two-component system chemotaxis sensor kinase CheA
MNSKDAEFLQKLLAMFKVEAREHLNVISAGLTEMEKGAREDRAGTVETVYREAHSLKGAARSVNLAHIVSICQSMENVFSALKRGQLTPSAGISDLLQQTVDFCYGLVEGGEVTAQERSTSKELIRRLDGSIPVAASAAEQGNAVEPAKPARRAGEIPGGVEPEKPEDREAAASATPEGAAAESSSEPQPPPPLAAMIPVVSDTVRISIAKLDSLLLQAEEMISVKLATGQRATELEDLQKTFDLWKKDRLRTGRAGNSPGDSVAKASSSDPFVAAFESRLTAMVRAAESDHRASAALVDKLLDDMKKTLMLPLSSLLEIFPRLVRDLARAEGKKVELTVAGGEIEIDRRVLEEMKDPLLHLVRNCVDHGIEKPDVRQGKGKPAHGTIGITISSRDGKIEIAVADDGSGIDVEAIKSSAVRQGLIAQEAVNKLGEREALQLIFHSGVTTSRLITDISGRGLGLAIVREKADKLNGAVIVDSRRDAGTTFRLVAPLTLATFRGTLIRVAEQLFVLPSTNVERVARIPGEAIQTVENRETLVFDEQPVSLVRLDEVLGIETAVRSRPDADAFVQVAVLGAADRRMAFLVDEVLHEQEVLVKPLGRQLSRVRNIAAATVLGNGRVVPILNVADLLKSAVTKAPSSIMGRGEEPEKSRAVLVVEDSITARTLLKNILESAGYEVHTAIDGVDGITALKSREFDIVVSDVEMPRMNGFDLTVKIRADKKLAELPVVLVTALESREDRERGMDVGANAYIVKSSFDQSNLLEVIGRLT